MNKTSITGLLNIFSKKIHFFTIIVMGILIMMFTNSSAQDKNLLEIKIKYLKNDRGNVLLQLLNENKSVNRNVAGLIKNGECLIKIDSISDGIYAVRYFHDENNNKKMDFNSIGIPKEGYGFSNNPERMFGKPAFNKILFEIKHNEIIAISTIIW